MKHFLLLALLMAPLLANENLDLENDFLTSLDEVSEIATKTKLNIDDTPSFVSVLRSEKLKKLGIENVFQALSLVPGVQLKKEASGVPIVVFRGVTQKGEVKLMVDGISINNSYRGSIYYYLDFPIEMIKRIEVIRGAGSVLYGSGAISGVVNIITNSSQEGVKNEIFISSGTYDNYKGGALVSGNIGDIKLSLDSYYQKNNKNISVNHLSSDRHLKDYSVGINLKDEHFELLGRIKKSDIGNAYGVTGVLDEDADRYNNENRSIFTQVSYKNNINQNNKITILGGYNNYQQIVEATHPSPAIDAIDADHKESSYFSEISLISTSLKDNELLIGAKFESTKTLKSQWKVGITPINPISDPKLSRKITSIYLNDNYSFSNNLDISAGLRYDHYSDFGSSYSPNLGLVYRINKQLRFKSLYSHAYRAPSWVELTSNSSLEAESSDSIEAGFIFKPNLENIFRVNFFASKIEDMIEKDVNTREYIQNAKNDFYGAEIEYIYNPNHKTELNFFASYINAKDKDGNNLIDVANILTSTSLIYNLGSGFTIGSILKYVSSSKRSQNDIREDMEDSLIFNQTISYSYKDFTATLIVKDLFDTKTYYALPVNNYNKDFDDGGRTILLKASIGF